jgi:hypothetical protein
MKQYNDSILYSKQRNILFKLSGRTVNISDLILRETTQGLFLIIENNIEKLKRTLIPEIVKLFNLHDWSADADLKSKMMVAEYDARTRIEIQINIARTLFQPF